MTDEHREAIADLIREGYTSGRLDVDDGDGGYTFVAWELKTNEWKDDND